MERRKSGRDPRKAAWRARRIHRILNSFVLLSLPQQCSWHTNNDRSRHPPGNTASENEGSSPPAPAVVRFYEALASVYLHFRFLSSAFIPESRVDGKAPREKSGSKWLSDFHFLASLTLVPFLPPPPNLALPRFSTFPQEWRNSFFLCL